MYQYPIIAPPFTLEFREMSKKELKAYCNWFIDQIPLRVAILERTVKNTPGFEDWEMNYLPTSLDKLGEWFALQAEKRERTEDEIQEAYNKLSGPFKDIHMISKWELTNKTYSIAIDIGMYVSQVFLKTFPSLEWQFTLKGRKDHIDYGQPVLAGFGKMAFNPPQIMIVLAHGLVNKKRNKYRLRELYETWKKYIAD